ncbi:hypothetical protein D9757_010048 [Collybiopsis confluens]|uniref:Uncharacterized protein n=1 Tax=Collybiopsis confluens TaxID=2823264 RepID=A0A8H5GZW0_9AGAR|nr:hypothetical protein D9757_010048 [Collybiopsis confluens]
MSYRERRSWTEEEDQLLRDAVDLEEPGTLNPSKWHAIAKHVPTRTNKDCRKRWFAKMASDVVKGGWAPEEDERLVQAIEKYGTRWSLVSAHVQTRNSDQCAKRWTDTLNPMIDRTRWSAEADALLIKSVQEHGKLWTKIVRIYFPGRTGLAAKNRYNSITRFNTRAPRRKAYKSRAPSESASSTVSSSPSLSPVSPTSSASDISESPRTPPSFELNPILVAEPSSYTENSNSEFVLDPTTWSPTASDSGCVSSSAPLTYEELCSALLPSTSSTTMTSLGQSSGSWDETMSHIQHAICADSPLSPSSSHSLESFETFFSYQSFDPSNTEYLSPISPTSDASATSSLYQPTTTEEAPDATTDSEYSFPRNTVFWEPPVDPNAFLVQWSGSY